MLTILFSMLRIPKCRAPWLTARHALHLLIEVQGPSWTSSTTTPEKETEAGTAAGRAHAAAAAWPSSSGSRTSWARGRSIRMAAEQDRIFSMILWGPPGCGKTTLARIIAGETRSHFVQFSAVLSGVKEIRAVIDEARRAAAAAPPPHRPLRGRDPPLQQGPAGRLPAPRRERADHPDRRHDREPVLRGHRAAALALPRGDPEPARPRRTSPPIVAPGPRRTRSGGSARQRLALDAGRARALLVRVADGDARCGPEQPGGGRLAGAPPEGRRAPGRHHARR
ncbi:MAG: AAA family ATPase [Desulfobacterales bacterium]|nr:AAA family ATPase [Desulfobacterales bacterium]